MKYIEIRIRVPVIDLRILSWAWATIMAAWREWHMSRMDHRAPAEEWAHKILSAHGWRARAETAFPKRRGP